jgi:hypothetical protein
MGKLSLLPTLLVKLPKENKLLGQVFSKEEKLGACFCRETIQGSWKALGLIEIVHSFHFFIFHPYLFIHYTNSKIYPFM